MSEPSGNIAREALRLKMTRRPVGISGRIARAFLESKLTPLLVVFSLLVGVFARFAPLREKAHGGTIDLLQAPSGDFTKKISRFVLLKNSQR